MNFEKGTVPFLSLEFSTKQVREQVEKKIKNVLDSNWFILGSNCADFEKNYSEFHNIQHTVGVGNGLDALIICLKALGIGSGDEVILPANTFIATALAVSYVGATPVLVEPSEETYNIQAENIKKHITNKTKAIIPVHLYGQACEMQEILKLSQSYGIPVIEDNAQAQGAKSNNKMVGTFGRINATSFYPGKNLGAFGDGGAITTSDADLAKLAKMFRSYGSTVKYVHEVKGQNSRLDEIQAVILNEKLKLLDSWNQERQKIASLYDKELSLVGDLIIPKIANGVTHVYHLYVVRTSRRDELQNFLKNNGVETLIHYPIPIHLQNAYKELGFKEGSFPIAENLAKTSLSLPLYPGLSLENQMQVIKEVKRFFNV
jgi:dTDP-4-amino-4,6-dideoxygalactose transaminase